MFELSGRWQHDIRMPGGVGHEMLDHDREKIRAAQAAPYRFGIDLVHECIMTPDHQPLHWRLKVIGRQVLAEPAAVETSGSLR